MDIAGINFSNFAITCSITNKNIFRKNEIRCKVDVRLMIDRDAGERKYENKVGLSVTKL